MHAQPHFIYRVLAWVSSVGLLLAIFGCIALLMGMTDMLMGRTPLLATETSTRTAAGARSSASSRPASAPDAPNGSSRATAHHGNRRPRDRASASGTTPLSPVLVDRGHDRRADLTDMAIAIRWHRGARSDLPPGSD
jgi:hypothetical protein